MLKHFLLATLLTASALATPLQIQVDASQAPRRLFRVHLSLPVSAGPQHLVYPKWLPGEHGPTGPLDSLVDLHIRAGQRELEWQRDPLEMYRLNVQVPEGISTLDIDFSMVGGFASEKLGVVSWNEVVLFPEGQAADQIRVLGQVKLPVGWSGVSALNSKPASGEIHLPESDLATMVDSPLLMGQYMSSLTLKARAFEHVPALPQGFHVVAERSQAAQIPPEYAKTLTRLVEETGLVFASRHYAHYDWLLSLTNVERGFGGLEHHQSSDNVMPEETLLEETGRQHLCELLAHEFVHSWNGKFRRPEGLLSPDYMKPMDGSLLWVYEGLTTFWGDILPVRAGAVKPERFREMLAVLAASFEHEAGKRWRPLADTATAAQRLYAAPKAWRALRRGVDFYAESVLLWLEVDGRLRELSGDELCLDDFCHAFYGGPSGTPQVKPYREDELYQLLQKLAPYDWKRQIRGRLDAKDGKYFKEALEISGWKLVYNDTKNAEMDEADKKSKGQSRMFNLGLSLDSAGKVIDVDEGGPAAQAGLAPGMTLVAVNQRKYDSQGLDEAIAARAPVRLLVENGAYYRDLTVNWSGGPHIPHLERIAGRPDRLSEVLKARAPQE